MATFATGDQSLNLALGSLAEAMFPDPSTQMSAVYRGAAANKAAADAEKARVEAQLLREREARAQAAAPALANLLTVDIPGASPDIMGAPSPVQAARIDAIESTLPAILAREGNTEQFAQGLGAGSGMLQLLTGQAEGEDAARRAFGLYTGTTPQFEGGEAVNLQTQQQLLDDIQAADALEAMQTVQARVAAEAANPGPFTLTPGSGRFDAEGNQIAAMPANPAKVTPRNYQTPDGQTGTTHDGGLTDARTGQPLPAGTTVFGSQVQGSQEDVLSDPTVRLFEQRLEGGVGALERLVRVRNVVVSNPQVVGATGSLLRGAKGVFGQILSAGRALLDDDGKLAVDQWVREMQSRIPQGDSPEARFQGLMIDLAVQLARQAESGGRLSDQDIQRQFQRLGQRLTGDATQVLVSLDEVERSIRADQARLQKGLEEGRRVFDLPSEADTGFGARVSDQPQSGAGTPDNPYTGLTREQYNELPVGAHYSDAQGNVYRKN